MFVLTLLLGCVHPTPPTEAASPSDVPHLPAPRAGLYTHHVSTPPDPLVASVMQGLAWDEALGGAAAGVALELVDGRTVDTYGLRWKAVLAGYPYPVARFGSAEVSPGTVAEALAAEARAQAQAGADVGLVRARARGKDIWVLLVGSRRGDLPAFAREAKVGERVDLRAPVLFASPEGAVARGSVVALDQAGEWLVQARDEAGVVATVPVYVNTKTPLEPPIQDDARGDTPEAAARDLVAALAGWYGRSTPGWDPGLDSVARARLRTLLDGGELPPATGQLAAAGWVGLPVAGGECRGTSVAACLDGMWWSPERRGVLVADLDTFGVAAGRLDGDVVLAIVGVKEGSTAER